MIEEQSMKRILTSLFIVAFFVGTTASNEIFQSDKCHFSFIIPEGCQVSEEVSNDKNYYWVYRTYDKQLVAYVSYTNHYEEGKALDYKLMRNIIRKNDTCTIVEEKPFYDLLRQDFAYLRTYPDGSKDYIRTLIKVSSYITITCPYPLSQESQKLVTGFDNQPSFRGNLRRAQQNAGSITICIFLTLLCFLGYNSRGNRNSWLYILLSSLLIAIAVFCLWQDKVVMAFIIGLSIIIWSFFFSHNKTLMWLIESIF